MSERYVTLGSEYFVTVTKCLDPVVTLGLQERYYRHINNALKEELADEVVVAKFANTTQHGAIEGKTQTHEKEYFNLEMVTSVGYTLHSFIHLFKYSIMTGRFLKMNGSGWG